MRPSPLAAAAVLVGAVAVLCALVLGSPLLALGVLAGVVSVLGVALGLLCWLRREVPSPPRRRREVRGQVLFSSLEAGRVHLDCVGDSPLGPFTLELSSLPSAASDALSGSRVASWLAAGDSPVVVVAVEGDVLCAVVSSGSGEAAFLVERVRGLAPAL